MCIQCIFTPVSYILLYIVFINSCLNKHSPDSITLYPWRRQHHHIWQSTHWRSAIGTCSLTSTHWHSFGTCSSHPFPPKACWWKGWWIKWVGEFTLSWWIWTITDEQSFMTWGITKIMFHLSKAYVLLFSVTIQHFWKISEQKSGAAKFCWNALFIDSGMRCASRCPLSINHSNHVLGKA